MFPSNAHEDGVPMLQEQQGSEISILYIEIGIAVNSGPVGAQKRTGNQIHSLDPGSVVLYAILYVDEEVDTILYFGPIFFFFFFFFFFS